MCIRDRDYLKEHRPVLFNAMMVSGKLYPHLNEIEQTMNRRLEQMCIRDRGRPGGGQGRKGAGENPQEENPLRGNGNGPCPVSYTHLDVYKRQAEGRKKLADEIRLAWDVRQWVEAIQEYADITELDAATLNRLIKEIVVHESIDSDKTRHISIEIHFNLKPIPEVEQVTA